MATNPAKHASRRYCALGGAECPSGSLEYRDNRKGASWLGQFSSSRGCTDKGWYVSPSDTYAMSVGRYPKRDWWAKQDGLISLGGVCYGELCRNSTEPLFTPLQNIGGNCSSNINTGYLWSNWLTAARFPHGSPPASRRKNQLEWDSLPWTQQRTQKWSASSPTSTTLLWQRPGSKQNPWRNANSGLTRHDNQPPPTHHSQPSKKTMRNHMSLSQLGCRNSNSYGKQLLVNPARKKRTLKLYQPCQN